MQSLVGWWTFWTCLTSECLTGKNLPQTSHSKLFSAWTSFVCLARERWSRNALWQRGHTSLLFFPSVLCTFCNARKTNYASSSSEYGSTESGPEMLVQFVPVLSDKNLAQSKTPYISGPLLINNGSHNNREPQCCWYVRSWAKE